VPWPTQLGEKIKGRQKTGRTGLKKGGLSLGGTEKKKSKEVVAFL